MIDISWFNDLSASQQKALLEGPALKPPPGHQPNFINPPDKDRLGVSLFITAGSIAFLFVAVQFYSRIVHHKSVFVEDYVSLGALGAFAAFIYFCMKVVDSPSLLVHQWNMKLKEMSNLLYNVSAGSTVYGNVIMMLKVGILLQWIRLFVPKGTRNIFWWSCHITLWINVLFYTICTFVEIFDCEPREKLWNIWIKGSCFDMPKRVIWSLHMSSTPKAGTGAIFSVGIIGTACAGLRIQSTFEFSNTEDIPYTISELGMWCCAEIMAGFLVLCLPSIPKLFRSSPWILKLVSSIKSWQRPSLNPSDLENNRSWPRLRNKREPDASLLTDTNGEGFVPLTNISVGSVYNGQLDRKSSSNNHFEATGEHHGIH